MTSNDWGAAVIGAALATIVTVPLAPIFWAVFITYFLFCIVMMLRTHRREIDEQGLSMNSRGKEGSAERDCTTINEQEGKVHSLIFPDFIGRPPRGAFQGDDLVGLVGAEINAEIEHQTAVDTTEGARKPLGARGATMADTLGAAK